MANPHSAQAIHQYSRVRTHGGVESANPHQLTAMLFDGALSRIASARGHMQRGEIAAKGECISRSIEIIGGLRSSLDHDRGGELAARLDSLYEYMGRRLLYANLHDDIATLDEVADLLRPIRGAWAEIPAALHDPRSPADIAP
ncbi:MAG TPA: flagellar export chaperone FliS [Rhodanobacteraceae bacterium]|nr:flagellar export chaperone FliS [Oleiagrimonas sp.]HET9819536.1 flagellar export chaperone FliS [Rhodanobacteraceae bacterium]